MSASAASVPPVPNSAPAAMPSQGQHDQYQQQPPDPFAATAMAPPGGLANAYGPPPQVQPSPAPAAAAVPYAQSSSPLASSNMVAPAAAAVVRPYPAPAAPYAPPQAASPYAPPPQQQQQQQQQPYGAPPPAPQYGNAPAYGQQPQQPYGQQPPTPAPPPSPFAPGRHVLVQWADGNRYPATVHQFANGQCLVVFPNGQQHWVELRFLAPA